MSRLLPILLAGLVVSLTAGVASAQTSSSSSEVKKFEVLAVDGNDLYVRLPEGTRQINVPPGFTFTVDGKPLSVGDLKPGMSGTATITTRTTVTPVTVTEVKTGTVALTASNAVYLRTPEGVRMFTQGEVDKRGIKVFVDGKPKQLSELRQGDRISATIVTSRPPTVVTEKDVQATLAKAASAPAPVAAAPPAPAAAAPVPTRAPAPAPPQPVATAARELPKTAGSLPMLALAGVVSLTIGAFAARRRRTQ